MPIRLATVLLAASVMVGACSGGSPVGRAAGGRVQVVAAENFWGSIAVQLAGDRAQVTSIVDNPATDPHDYEATPRDARLVAGADYVVVNGIGYDAWAQKLLDSNPDSGRVVLDVGKLVGVKTGGNPHQWYSPVVARVAADLSRIDAANADYYEQRRVAFETTGLREYHTLIASIHAQYAGTPIGGSESIIEPLVSVLGLDLKTPESFLDAVAEGGEPSARDTTIVNRQIAQKAIAVFIFNRQNATPDVERLVAAARAGGIAVTTVTETMVPAGTTFQAWQSRELRDLRDALTRAKSSS
jgi:zinc/manganese transport system substrate-binding protein